jgi:aspartyl-tRNA(Asn)/glutamyl-tRNA(Gln) amidotransferase subunit C
MAKLTREDILKLAQLAKLQLDDHEVETFQTEITEILGYVEMLKDVDTDGLEPTYQVTGLTNVTRPDKLKDYGSSQESLLKNVPNLEGKYIKVKRMVG